MSHVIFQEGKSPEVHENIMPSPHEYPCDTYMYNTFTREWWRRVFTGAWQYMEEDEYITIPSTIRAWILLLE